MKGTEMAAKKSNSAVEVKLPKEKESVKKATITIINGCFAGLEIPLKKARTVLGRNIGCDICLDHPLVSGEHAVIQRTSEGFVVEDLNSHNGLTLNGKEIHRKKMRNGDMISIGRFRLKFSYHEAKS
ncbi:MAG: FHA domain-containing protein, partial [Candidatus Krumholzibacteria bacterium]|nr:FHA domain-containing protein [Candidatus Krumholzibacteria bacterium]